ncbi:MAG: hypothetical protein JXR48_00270 [Candidatus Delongbacteria bacterium]|nr:hypothetical protein [Candidatus Delongbacteria bacterium]
MNQDEKIAEKYLKKHYTNILYEPDGNIPPDFSVNGSIGVEVRRLNQQHSEKGNTKGLEEQSIPLYKAVEGMLSKFPKDIFGNNYWLTLRYKRNIGKLKDIKKNTDLAIKAFQSQKEPIPYTYKLSDNVTLEFAAKTSAISRKYKIGIESDQNSGGWVIDMYITNTTHCIEEKEQKIKLYKAKYKFWWLLLVDHINCMDSYDKNDIEKGIKKSSSFDRTIVIKHNEENQFEI